MNDEWDKQTALNKAARFCAYQERSIREIRDKLSTRISNNEIIEEIIQELIADDFINEQRFAESFIKGKFYSKKWGKIKIRYALKSHGIGQAEADIIFNDLIPENAYREAVSELMQKKIQLSRNQPTLETKGKVFRHLAAKGYEQYLIYELWDEQGFDV